MLRNHHLPLGYDPSPGPFQTRRRHQYSAQQMAMAASGHHSGRRRVTDRAVKRKMEMTPMVYQQYSHTVRTPRQYSISRNHHTKGHSRSRRIKDPRLQQKEKIRGGQDMEALLEVLLRLWYPAMLLSVSLDRLWIQMHKGVEC